MSTEFRIPELGENVETADLLKVLVSVGDTISRDQPVLELETDKATVEVPSPVGGLVKAIHVKAGDKVKVGQLVFTVEDGTGTKATGKSEAPPAPEKARMTKQKAAAAPQAQEAKEKEAVEPAAQEAPAPPVGEDVPPAFQGGEVVEITRARRIPEPGPPKHVAPAAPSVRRHARELGLNIDQVPGSGPGGRISVEDVTRYARTVVTNAARASSLPVSGVPLVAAPLPDFSKWGEVERQSMSNVRRKTAEHMALAWDTVPQVTQYDKADITDTDELRRRFAKKAEEAGGKLTVTAIAVKVVVSALRVFPQFASSIDMARNEIIYKKYAHIGVAVDTGHGLLVPVIRDADRKNILEISRELAQLAEKARNKKIATEEMQGGVFTITNLGGIAGTNFSPIVNHPEAAILGMARASLEPVWRDGQFIARLMLPLSLSYDHRLIDGADAARFLRWVAEALEQPFLLPLQG